MVSDAVKVHEFRLFVEPNLDSGKFFGVFILPDRDSMRSFASERCGMPILSYGPKADSGVFAGCRGGAGMQGEIFMHPETLSGAQITEMLSLALMHGLFNLGADRACTLVEAGADGELVQKMDLAATGALAASMGWMFSQFVVEARIRGFEVVLP